MAWPYHRPALLKNATDVPFSTVGLVAIEMVAIEAAAIGC